MTKKEMIDTGADFEKLDFDMINSLTTLERNLLIKYGWKLKILLNGLNSGGHTGETHNDGIAVDFIVEGEKVIPKYVIWEMIRAGFNGIGFYRNKGKAVSYHGDTRIFPAQWRWDGDLDENDRKIYKALFIV